MRCKYRIVQRQPGRHALQWRPTWWPFWANCHIPGIAFASEDEALQWVAEARKQDAFVPIIRDVPEEAP